MIFVQYLRARLFDWRKKRAIRQARRLADLHRRKYLVMLCKGRPVVVSMQGLKKQIATKKLRGLSAEKARQIAILEASPRNPSASCS